MKNLKVIGVTEIYSYNQTPYINFTWNFFLIKSINNELFSDGSFYTLTLYTYVYMCAYYSFNSTTLSHLFVDWLM